MWTLPIAVLVGLFGLTAWVRLRPALPVRDTLRVGAEGDEESLHRLGLSPVEGGATGVVEGLSVRYVLGAQPRALWSLLGAQSPAVYHRWELMIPTGTLSLHLQPFRTPRERFVKTGDEPFDAAFALDGHTCDLGWLGFAVRQRLLQLVELQPRLAGGRLSVERAAFRPADLSALVALAKEVIARQADPIGRTEEMMRDPLPSVRRAYLWRLQTVGDPLFEKLARGCLHDVDPSVRALAAIFLRDVEGSIQAALSPELPIETRWEAVVMLRYAATSRQRLDVAEQLARHPSLQAMALDLLGTLGAVGLPIVLEIFESASEPVLSQAVGLIAEFGTVADVPVLRARLTALPKGRTGRLIERTIAAFQYRSGGVVGALSIADSGASAGALSEVRQGDLALLSPLEREAAPERPR